MHLEKYSNKIILKELSLRNFTNLKCLDSNFIYKNLNTKIFFPVNNYSSLKNINSSFFIFSYFFSTLFLNTFKVKLSFSKKVYIKRRKKKIRRQVNGIIFFFKDSLNFFNLLETLLYTNPILPLHLKLYKTTINRFNNNQNDIAFLNLNIPLSIFFANYFNNLLYSYQFCNNFFISFFFRNLNSNVLLFFFLRSFGFNINFKKISI